MSLLIQLIRNVYVRHSGAEIFWFLSITGFRAPRFHVVVRLRAELATIFLMIT